MACLAMAPSSRFVCNALFLPAPRPTCSSLAQQWSVSLDVLLRYWEGTGSQDWYARGGFLQVFVESIFIRVCRNLLWSSKIPLLLLLLLLVFGGNWRRYSLSFLFTSSRPLFCVISGRTVASISTTSPPACLAHRSYLALGRKSDTGLLQLFALDSCKLVSVDPLGAVRVFIFHIL